MNRTRSDGPSGLLIATGVGLGLSLLGLNWFLGAFACDENEGCAHGPLREWQGRVFTADGRPAERAVIRYPFESMRPLGETIAIQTDEHGRYCFRWPEESVRVEVSVEDVQSSSPADPRFETATPKDFFGEARAGPIVLSPDVTSERIGALPATRVRLSGSLWRPTTDTAADCPKSDVQPPWHRVDDLRENWRYRLLFYLSLGCVGMALAALVTPRQRRRSVAKLAFLLGGVDSALFVLIWFTKTL